LMLLDVDGLGLRKDLAAASWPDFDQCSAAAYRPQPSSRVAPRI